MHSRPGDDHAGREFPVRRAPSNRAKSGLQPLFTEVVAADLQSRAPSLWRYRELLPLLPGDEVSLVEGLTPLLQVETNVWVKDASRNPTGSFAS